MGSGSVIGFGGAPWMDANFTNAPVADTWYPGALVNALSGVDGYPGKPEIAVAFNSANTNWYLGTNGATPAGKIDFVTVVLHEIGHGWGFLGTLDYDDGIYSAGVNPDECAGVGAGYGCWNQGGIRPDGYDRFVVNNLGQSLINTGLFGNPSLALGAQLKSDNIFFNGPHAFAANGGANVKLFAPATWVPGSSISHLAESFNGTPNALMTKSINYAEADHAPGPVALGILKDIGWSLTPPSAPASLSVSPISWTNNNVFSIGWTNPATLLDIAGAWYKVGSAPTGDSDGTYMTTNPFNATATSQGGQAVYVWLQDILGNKSYANLRSATLYYDGTPPTDGTLTATKGNASVALSWTAASDTGGSGLASANRYIVKSSTIAYPSATCSNGTQVYLGMGTSVTDSSLINGLTYYYRVCAYDAAGNVSSGATATATLTVSVQFNTSPSGKVVTIDGGDHTAPWSAAPWATGSSHTVNVTSPQDQTADTRYVFASWSDGGAQSHSVAPVVDTTYTATFKTQYVVTTDPDPGVSKHGTVTPLCEPPTGCWYDSGALQVLAIPDAGYVVDAWGVDCSAATGLAYVLTVNSPKDCTVTFKSCGGGVKPVQNARIPATYDSIGGGTGGYDLAVSGDTLRLVATTLSETLDFNRTGPEITVTLKGGYACDFSGPSGPSIISGSVTVSRGTVIADGILIK